MRETFAFWLSIFTKISERISLGNITIDKMIQSTVILLFVFFLFSLDSEIFSQTIPVNSEPQLIVAHERVNDVDNSGSCSQSKQSIVSLNYTGQYFSAWCDLRNGEEEIYGQFLGLMGHPEGENIKISDSPVHGNIYPQVAADENGMLVVLWGEGNCFNYQVLSRDSGKIGGNEIISLPEEYSSLSIFNPYIVFNGGVITIFCNGRLNNQTALYVLKQSTGNALSLSVEKIDEGENTQIVSSGFGRRIANNGTNELAVVWSEYYENQPTIFYRDLISSQTSGLKIQVSNPPVDSYDSTPSVSYTSGDYCMIVWERRAANGNIEVFGRIIKGTEFQTDEFIIYNSDSDPYQFQPTISGNNKGFFAVCWNDIGSIRLDFIDTLGVKVRPSIKYKPEDGWIYWPVVGSRDNGDVIVSWGQGFGKDNDIYAKVYRDNSQYDLEARKLNDDVNSSWQTYPTVGVFSDGGYVVAWEDYKHGNTDIALQVYDRFSERIGDNVLLDYPIASNGYPIRSEYPRIYVTPEDNFLLLSEISQYLVIQKYSKYGAKVSSPLIIESDGSSFYTTKIKFLDNSERFCLNWISYQNGKVHNSVVVQSDMQTVGEIQTFPIVGSSILGYEITDRLDIVYLLKSDIPINGNRVFLQSYNRNGETLNDKIFPFANQTYFYNYKHIPIKNDMIIMFYQCWSNGMYHLNAKKMYDSEVIGELILQSSNNILNDIDVKTDFNGNLIFSWKEANHVYARVFDSDFMPKGNILKISSAEAKELYDIDYSNNILVNAFESNLSPGTGIDIYYDLYNIEESTLKQSVKVDVNNYPNPFNCSTNIVINLTQPSQVTLKVFDLLGRQVYIKNISVMMEGRNEIEFDAHSLSTGVYIYSVDAGREIKSGKMLLLK